MTDSFGATGRQSSQFFAYCLFSHTRCLKRRAYLFFVRGLQPRSYIAKMVRPIMCCRQVEGPIGMLFASAVFLRSLITLIGELRTPKLPKFLPKRNACAPVYTQRYYTARPIWTNEGSKRVIPRKDVPFGGLNVVPLNFGSQTLKMIFWPMKKLKRGRQKVQILTTSTRH